MKSYKELWHNHERSWIEESHFKSEVRADQTELKALHSFISLGTERQIMLARLDPKTASYIRIPNMKGDFIGSFTYGYSFVGAVQSDGAENDRLGFILCPHQEMARVSEQEVYYFEGIDPKLATLALNMETAITAVWDAKVDANDKVLIVGCGIIGALTAVALKYLYNIEATIYDINPARLDKAKKNGLKVAYSEDEVGDKYNIAIHSSTTEEGLQYAIDRTGYEGKVVELSWFGSSRVGLILGTSFHYLRKQIISSQVGAIPGHMKGQWNYQTRKDLAFEILKATKPIYLFDYEIDFDNTPDFFNELRKRVPDELGVIINY